MARKRMLSPEMFTSPTVVLLPVAARWTWAGLLCYFDDYGYGEDAATLVKAAVWPRDETYTTRKIAADLDRIEAVESVCRFMCCGLKQMHAPKWTDWQTVAHPGKPRFCPCPTHAPAVHEEHRRDSCGPREDFNPNVVEVNEGEEKLSDADLVTTHSFAKCPDPRRHHEHRVRAVS